MALALNMAGGRVSEVVVSEVIFAFGQVATAPYTTPTTGDVPDTLAPYLACYDAILMERHGSITLGVTLEQAFIRLDALEHSARIAAFARLMGGASEIPPAEVERLYSISGADAQLPYRRADQSCPPLEPADAEQGRPLEDRLIEAVLARLRGGGR